jgi:hypothetical protein
MMNAEKLASVFGAARVEVQVADLIRALSEPMEGIDMPAIYAALPSSTPKIGEPWEGQGGIYAGVMRGEGSKPDYHLIVPARSAAVAKGITWGGRGVDDAGAKSDFDGLANTRALTASSQEHPAAKWAAALRIDGHDDFYLPARRELGLLCANVPELFEKVWHWSSTQYSANDAWGQLFGDGHQNGYDKGTEFQAVAVRRLVF